MAAEADFGLQAGEIERIRLVLAAHPAVEQALVYGSRAKGDGKDRVVFAD